MLVASDDATSGSVIANADRMLPSSSGLSQRSCCSGLPNIASTSMLPVSGAEQLSAGGARWPARPVISASGAYWRLVRPAPCSLTGQEEVPEPALAGLGAQLLEHRRGGPGERVLHRLELVVEDLLGRLDLRGHEVEQLLLQLLGAGVEREVHASSSPSGSGGRHR